MSGCIGVAGLLGVGCSAPVIGCGHGQRLFRRRQGLPHASPLVVSWLRNPGGGLGTYTVFFASLSTALHGTLHRTAPHCGEYSHLRPCLNLKSPSRTKHSSPRTKQGCASAPASTPRYCCIAGRHHTIERPDLPARLCPQAASTLQQARRCTSPHRTLHRGW
jgi:hypothetical protein